jgi:GT2 family glycosyltransferase
MGEDADFSFRVSRVHRLAVEPNATCVHTVTPTTRDSSRARTREGTENTYRRVIRYRALGLSAPAFWWATAGDVVIRGTYALVTRDRAALNEVAGILEGIRSIVASDFQHQAREQAPNFPSGPDEEHGGTEIDVAPNLSVAEEGAAR